MKTVDVRLLVNDDVDVEYLISQLVSASAGPGAPQGAVMLVPDGQGRAFPSGIVRTKRSDLVWSGGIRRVTT